MDKLPLLGPNELTRVLGHLGFKFNRQKGSHIIFTHQDNRMVVVPIHSGRKIGKGLLSSIIKNQLRITREEFLRILEKL